jgi:DNA (cytosine-5)-methyltransferase 1
MAGSREKDWGKEKKFREGQTNQVLDDLFFDFIAIAAKLKPKVVVAENVKGMLAGNARGYVKQIFEAFEGIGYEVQLFLLDASTMGVPQKRERIFFVANRINKRIKLEFKEAEISVSKALKGVKDTGKPLTDTARVWWNKTPPGRAYSDVHPRKMYFSHKKLHPDRPALTQTASQSLLHWEEPRELSNMECKRLQTFPDDYDCKTTKAQYICGMSVPPYMMQRIATEIAVQLLKK